MTHVYSSPLAYKTKKKVACTKPGVKTNDSCV